MPSVRELRLKAEFARLRRGARQVKLYEHPELYDLAYPGPAGDLAFYRRRARHGDALYLGVGTGRVFAKIAGVNRQLIGLDYSRPMLAAIEARHPALRTRLRHGNVLDPTLYEEGAVDRILAPHSFFTQFREHELMQALQNCRRWLKPGGKLVTNNFSPFQNPPFSRRFELYRRRRAKNFDVTTYIEYAPIGQALLEWSFFRRRASQELLMARIGLHYYYPAEFERILRAAGFGRVKVYGGFAGEPVSLAASELVYIAKRSA